MHEVEKNMTGLLQASVQFAEELCGRDQRILQEGMGRSEGGEGRSRRCQSHGGHLPAEAIRSQGAPLEVPMPDGS